VASLLIALPLNGHLSFTGPAMALTTATKLRQPNRVPSHFIDFDFIVLVLFFLPRLLALRRTLPVGFHGVNTNISPFLLQNTGRKGYLFPQQNIAEHEE
jgi:hypothetical protein